MTPAERLRDQLTQRTDSETFSASDLADVLVVSDAKMAKLIDALIDALCRPEDPDTTEPVDESLWGPEPTTEEVRSAQALGRKRSQEQLRAVLQDSLTRDDAAALLGITPQAVSKRLDNGQMLALERGRRRMLPAWQIRDGRTLPGLGEVIAAYPSTTLSLSVWATTPNADLNSRTPADTLARRDGPRDVLEAVAAISADAW